MKNGIAFVATLIFLSVVGCPSSLKADGTIVDDSFFSESLNQNRMVDMYLPQGYEDNSNRYPVIYFLHGMGANQDDYGEIADALDSLIEGGFISPVIAVKPDGSVPPFAGSMYTNSALYGRFEDYIADDLIAYIDGHYRTIARREQRVIMGHSMGGFGAMTVAFRHPDLFCAVVSLSGFLSVAPFDLWRYGLLIENGGHGPYNPDAGFITLATFTAAGAFSPNLANPPYYVNFPLDNGGNAVDSVYQRWTHYMPGWLAAQDTAVRNLAISFDCGQQDELGFYPMNQYFNAQLDTLGIVHRFQSFTGNHTNRLRTRGSLGIVFLDSVMQIPNSVNRSLSVITDGFNLAQNYPNPFNSVTQIEFMLPHATHVNVAVYNLLGREVATLIDGFTSAGTHAVRFNGNDLASGVYLCRMDTGEFAQTKKIVLMK